MTTRSVSTMASTVLGFLLASLVVIGVTMFSTPKTADAAVRVDSNTVVVESGDTLSEIARDYLGDASRANDIARFNGISNPDRIFPGQVINLPGTTIIDSNGDDDENFGNLFELLILEDVLNERSGSTGSRDLVDLFIVQELFNE